MKRVFDKQRSDLFDLAMNATSDFLAKALVIYADDQIFQTESNCGESGQASMEFGSNTNEYVPYRRGEIAKVAKLIDRQKVLSRHGHVTR